MRHEEAVRQQTLDKLKHEDTVRQHALEEKKLLIEMLKCEAITREEFRDKINKIDEHYLPLFANTSRPAAVETPPPAATYTSRPAAVENFPTASTSTSHSAALENSPFHFSDEDDDDMYL